MYADVYGWPLNKISKIEYFFMFHKILHCYMFSGFVGKLVLLSILCRWQLIFELCYVPWILKVAKMISFFIQINTVSDYCRDWWNNSLLQFSQYPMSLTTYIRIVAKMLPFLIRINTVSEYKKGANIGHFGAKDDPIIRIRKFFGEIGLLRL